MIPLDPHLYLLLCFGVFGLLVGSFLNVVILRLPKEESIVSPGSHCTICDRNLSWYENIPVLSWLALRGRCRTCGTTISARYAVVELLTAGLALLVALHFLPKDQAMAPERIAAALVYFLFGAALLAIAFIDMDEMYIPDVISKPGILLGIIATSTLAWWGVAATTPAGAVLGALVGWTLIWLVRWIGSMILGQEAMGLGDAKLLAMIGAWLGPWPELVVVVLLASIGGSIGGILWGLIQGKSPRGVEMPFGPWLVLGALGALLYGDKIVGTYLNALGLG